MQLNDLYRALLATAGMSVTKDGFVRLEEKGEFTPATKGGRQAVIPLPEQLASPLLNDRLVMHLLSENVLEPESPELAFFRSLLVHRFNKVVATLMAELLELGASGGKHKNLNSDQAEYLRLIAGVDGNSVKNWNNLVRAMPARQVQRAITHVYLKKAGMVGGKSFKRVATVKFPLYEELALWEKEDQTRQVEKEAGHKVAKKKDGAKVERPIYDVVIRKMDREPFMNLLQYLIPQIAEPDAYNYGSNSMMAPGVDALMHAFMNMASRVNDVIDTFTGVIDGIEQLRFNTEWVPAFENIDLMWNQVRDIPRMSNPDTPLPTATATAAPAPVAQPAPAPAPVQPQQPQQPANLPWNTAPAPAPQGQYINGQWVPAAPVGAWHPNQAPQQPQQQSAPAGGGVSAADLFRANPVVAGAAMMSPNVQAGMMPQMYPGMMPGMYPGMVPGMMPGMMPPGMYPMMPGMYPAAAPMQAPQLPQGNLPWQQRRGY